MRLLLFAGLLLIGFNCYTQSIAEQDYKVLGSRIDDYVNHLIKRQGIPGLSLAIVKNDAVIYRKNFGFANLEHQVPTSDESIFRVYSLTKPMVSVEVFALIEAGKLRLDDPVDKYVDGLPESWRKIRVEHLLSHSSGLPDMAPIPEFKDLTEEEAKQKVFAQDTRFGPGEQYEYNQTGFWLLQQVIEKITGKDMAASILENQFGESGEVFFSSDSRDVVLNRTTPYFPFAKGSLMIDHSYLKGDYAHAMNGLNMSMEEFIRWDEKLRKDELLNPASKNKMWQDFFYLRSNKKFAYGWDKRLSNGHRSYGFSGSLCTAYQTFPDDGLSIIFLSNGLGSWYSVDNTINYIAGLVDKDLVDRDNLGFESVLKASYENDSDGFSVATKKLRQQAELRQNNFETHLNDVGYFWLRALGNSEKAIEVFELNTREYPDSWNVFDSLAEAYAVNGNQKKAIANYRKAIRMNEDENYQETTRKRIESLKE